MSESQAIHHIEVSSRKPSKPRPTILMLMCWTLITAILYAAQLRPPLWEVYPHVHYMWVGVIGLINGAYCAGAITLFAGLIRKRIPRLHPGHWLLFFGFVLTVAELSSSLTLLGQLSRSLTAIVVAYLFQFLLYAWGYWLMRRNPDWMLFFVPLMFLAVFRAVYRTGAISGFATYWPHYEISQVTNWWNHGLFVLGLIMVAVDLVCRRDRDWLHWLGITCYSLTGAAGCVWMFLSARGLISP